MSYFRTMIASLGLFVFVGLPAFAQESASAPKAPTVSAGIEANALWDGRKIVPFKALDSPKMVKVDEATDFIDDGEYVLGVTINGESRAYPTRFAWWHHVINDTTTAGQPIAITYCSVCNTGICYDRTLDGKPVTLDFYGLYNGVAVLCDHASESVLLLAEGHFINGPLQDKALKAIPLLDTTWSKWKQRHPDTLIMSPKNDFEKVYMPKGMAERRGYTRFPMPFFERSLTRTDDRLPRFEKVLGVTVVEAGKPLWRAFPMKAVDEAGGTVADTIGATPVVVFLESDTQTAAAFSPIVDGKTLTFERKKDGDALAFFDKETGSRWNVEGKAESGPMMGKALTPVDNHLSQWYGWVAYFPDTSIYGKTDAPRTVALRPPDADTAPKPAPATDPVKDTPRKEP